VLDADARASAIGPSENIAASEREHRRHSNPNIAALEPEHRRHSNPNIAALEPEHRRARTHTSCARANINRQAGPSRWISEDWSGEAHALVSASRTLDENRHRSRESP
jgi:hypothetical protein